VRCLASDVKTIHLGKDLFGDGVEVFGDMRRANRVVQGTTHDGKDVSELVGQALFAPIGFPVVTIHKEEIDGPAIGVGATGAGEVFEENLERLFQSRKVFRVGEDERVCIVEEWLEFGRNGFSISGSGCGSPGFCKTWHSILNGFRVAKSILPETGRLLRG